MYGSGWADQPIALSHLSFGAMPAADRIPATAGIAQGIGWRFLPAAHGETLEPLLGDPAALRRLRRRMDDQGLLSSDAEILRIGPDGPPPAGAFFEACAIMGVPNVLVAADDRDPDRLCASLARLAEDARAHGLTLALEYMPWTAVPDAATALALVRRIGHPALRVLTDCLHLHRSGAPLPDPGSALHARYVQLCDAAAAFDPDPARMIAVARGERLPPGTGGIDLDQLLPGGFAPRLVAIEVPNAARQARQAPRDWLAELVTATRRALGQLDRSRRDRTPYQDTRRTDR